jgi:hypothetical protein
MLDRLLVPLAEVEATCSVQGRRDIGIRTVPIRQIRGSEGRCHDFDCDFNPLQSHTAHRWKSIVAAREQDKPLPPVTLIQVGDAFFVRDGHHRISVARAFGQQEIEAEVTLWKVSGPLPWERLADAPDRGLLRRLAQRLAGLAVFSRLKVTAPQASAVRPRSLAGLSG